MYLRSARFEYGKFLIVIFVLDRHRDEASASDLELGHVFRVIG